MWDEVLVKPWNTSVIDTDILPFQPNLFVSASPSESPLWSPSSTMSSETSLKSDSSCFSPDNWSISRYFSFKETELDLMHNFQSGNCIEDGGNLSSPGFLENWTTPLTDPNPVVSRQPHTTDLQFSVFQKEHSKETLQNWGPGDNGKQLSIEPISSPSYSDSLSPMGSSMSEEDQQPWSPNCHRRSNSISSSCSDDESLREVRCMWIDCKGVFDNQVRFYGLLEIISLF